MNVQNQNTTPHTAALFVSNLVLLCFVGIGSFFMGFSLLSRITNNFSINFEVSLAIGIITILVVTHLMRRYANKLLKETQA